MSTYDSQVRGKSLDAKVARIAARQHGIVTREQALRCGATPEMIQRRVESGRWERVYRGVYRLAGAVPTWRQSLIAACFSCGAGAVASHASAAPLFAIPSFEPGRLEVSLPRRLRRAGIITHSVGLPAIDVTRVDAIPVTTPTRTLIDIAGTATEEALEIALDDLLTRRLTSLPLLTRRLDDLGGSGRRGSAVLRGLIGERRSGPGIPRSVLETKTLRAARRFGLPRPVCQYEVRLDGKRVAALDFAWPDSMVAVEADGRRWHAGERRWRRDLKRGNMLTGLGWYVIHCTWDDLNEDPAAVLRLIADRLR